MNEQTKIDKINYNRSVKPRWRKPKWDEKPIDTYGLSTTTSLLIEHFPEFKDRKGIRTMLKSIRPEYSIKEFYTGIFKIIKKHTGLNYINKNHSGFYNVMIDIHRHFKKYLDFNEDLRCKYADKLLEIYEEYSFNEAPKNMEIAKEDLEFLYIKKGYSTTQIGNLFRCSHGTILSRLKKLNIPRRPQGSKSRSKHEVTLEDQMNLITQF